MQFTGIHLQRTRDLGEVTRRADLLIAAIGKERFITGDMIKPGATVIDYGINVVDEQLVGDVERGHHLKRTLTALDLTLLGIGCIIGTGIFVLTGTAAANQAGPAVPLCPPMAGPGLY